MSLKIRTRLREAVFGIQDGLISTMGALTGIAEGTENRAAVIIAGLVIIVVESLSMAAGSYLSSKSQREYLEHLLEEERKAIAKDPEGEKAELWEMYRKRGFTDDEIVIIENRLFSDEALLLEDMAHKELGICPAALEEPAQNAWVMGTAYVAGGLVPVIPYMIWPISTGLPVSVAGTLLTLFGFGALKGRFVQKSGWRSGFEMLLIAGVAAAAGYFIGHLARRWMV